MNEEDFIKKQVQDNLVLLEEERMKGTPVYNFVSFIYSSFPYYYQREMKIVHQYKHKEQHGNAYPDSPNEVKCAILQDGLNNLPSDILTLLLKRLNNIGFHPNNVDGGSHKWEVHHLKAMYYRLYVEMDTMRHLINTGKGTEELYTPYTTLYNIVNMEVT